MKLGRRPSPPPLLLLLLVFSVLLSMASGVRIMYGGIHDSPSTSSPEVEDLARFALQDHNHKLENAKLEFVRVVRAREQVVAGIMYYLTVEAIDAGKKKLFEAKIWVKPWMHFKEVEDFKHVSSADLDANQGD